MPDLALQDLRGGHRDAWRPAWAFKADTVTHLRRLLADAPRPMVHVCSGPSRIGIEDLTVDVEPYADVRGDATALPVRDVGTLIIDPPYGWDRGTRIKASLDLLHTWIRLDKDGAGWPVAPVMITVWRVLSHPSRYASAVERRRRTRIGRGWRVRRGITDDQERIPLQDVEVKPRA